VALKEDPSNRRLWEDELVKELSQAGSTATPSYRLYPSAVPDTQEVVQAIQRDHYDGVLIVYSQEPEASESYVSGYVTTEPVSRIDPWTRRWITTTAWWNTRATTKRTPSSATRWISGAPEAAADSSGRAPAR
jgi:hypothetical protein